MGIPQDRNCDAYVAYASKTSEQFSFWQTKRGRFSNFNSISWILLNMVSTSPNYKTRSPSVTKLHHQTYQPFLQQKHPRNCVFQDHKITSSLSYHAQYSLNQNYIIGTKRNYDPLKQYYIVSPFPTRLALYSYLKELLTLTMILSFLFKSQTVLLTSFLKWMNWLNLHSMITLALSTLLLYINNTLIPNSLPSF